MKFQPGQSGNPAGRPLGARNKKTIAMEEEIARHAQEAVETVLQRARGGDPTCLRLLIDRVVPTGTNRPLALELPMVRCADDAEAALGMVIEAFGRGAITVREFSPMLGSVDRMARVAERIQQNREREHERYKAQRVHGVHPSMIPQPVPDPLEPILAAIDRGEDPLGLDSRVAAPGANGEGLYPPVNSDAQAASSVDSAMSAMAAPSLPPRAQASEGEGGSPEQSEGEPGGALLHAVNPETALYSSVNFENNLAAEPPPPGAADAAPPSPYGGGMNEDERLYSPVNSVESGEESLARENRTALPDGGRLVAALATADGVRGPLYLDRSSMVLDPHPLEEIMRAARSAASDAERQCQPGMIGSSR